MSEVNKLKKKIENLDKQNDLLIKIILELQKILGLMTDALKEED